MSNHEAVNTGQLSQFIAESLKDGSIRPQLWQLADQTEDEGPYYASVRFMMFRLFKKYPPDIQSKVREATVGLIDGWTLDQQPRILTNLAYFANDTRAFTSVEPLVKIIDESLIPNIENENIADITAKVISVLGGLARDADEEAKRKLKNKFGEWINDPRLEELVALLINGICIADPSSFPEHMPRFLDVLRDHPDYFVEGGVAGVFKSIVPEQIIREGQKRLPSSYQAQFQRFLDAASVSTSKVPKV